MIRYSPSVPVGSLSNQLSVAAAQRGSLSSLRTVPLPFQSDAAQTRNGDGSSKANVGAGRRPACSKCCGCEKSLNDVPAEPPAPGLMDECNVLSPGPNATPTHANSRCVASATQRDANDQHERRSARHPDVYIGCYPLAARRDARRRRANATPRVAAASRPQRDCSRSLPPGTRQPQ
jgi:hypothetical protein